MPAVAWWINNNAKKDLDLEMCFENCKDDKIRTNLSSLEGNADIDGGVLQAGQIDLGGQGGSADEQVNLGGRLEVANLLSEVIEGGLLGVQLQDVRLLDTANENLHLDANYWRG